MSSEDRRPDWEFWKYLTELTILEAVTLSMDIDPNKLHYRRPPGTMGEVKKVRDESPEFEKRLVLAIRNLNVLEARGRYDVAELENCSVKLVKFTAVALSWNWKIPPEMAALAEPDKREAKILDLRRQVGQKQSEAAIERHASKRERTLAAVIKTIATADRQNYISETSQKIIVAKLAQLVEDNRFNYGNILNVEGIEDIVGRILNGTYFA